MDNLVLTGMVIKTSDVGEYDKRLCILTKERGKIVAFARGARRPKSSLIGASRLFSFGEFSLYEGREAYTLQKADISNYFTEISEDIEAMCYGSYFMEMADHFSREGIESSELLKLLYYSLRALSNKNIQNELVRYVFELKNLVINGLYPETFQCVSCKSTDIRYFSAIKAGTLCDKCGAAVTDGLVVNTSTVYTMQYIISSKIEKLYRFTVNKEVLEELRIILNRYNKLYVGKEFNSLQILNTILK